MAQSSALDDLVRRARNRQVWNLILTQSVQAVSFGMGGVILLLLLGTQILDWPWIAGLVGVTAGLGIRRTLKRLPSRYEVVQVIDRRLELRDSLSTAFFFKQLADSRRGAAWMREAQILRAEGMAGAVDLGQAVPISAPRSSLYALAALCVVATSLFALRYGISRRLDLRVPLATMLFQTFYPSTEEQAANKKPDVQQRFKRVLKELGISVEAKSDRQGTGRESSETVEGELAQGDDPSASSRQAEQAKAANPESGNQGRQGEAAEGEEGSEANAGDRASSEIAGDQSADSQNPGEGEQQAANNGGENKGLLEKFREAMANLMSKLKSQPRQGGSQMASASTQSNAESGRSKQSPGNKGTPGTGRQRSDASASSESPSDEEAEGSERTQSASGKTGGRESDTQASKEGKSGIGREDGSKDTREAEQLAAMGKISEILGRRAANLSGEVTVEVASGAQRLRTPYSQQEASHTEAGGEIHRDEVPLLFQQYVRQYFEQVRKQPAPEAKPKQP